MNYSKMLMLNSQEPKLPLNTEKLFGLYHQLLLNVLLMFFYVHGNVLKSKCKLQYQELILLIWFPPSIKLKEKDKCLKLSDLSGQDKFHIPLLNLLLLNTLSKKCINMYSLLLNHHILIQLNSELLLHPDIWLVFSVPLFLTLLIQWFLN